MYPRTLALWHLVPIWCGDSAAASFATLPGFVGSGGFVKALAAGHKKAPQYFDYCLGRNVVSLLCCLEMLETQPHNTSKQLRKQNSKSYLKCHIRILFSSIFYLILRSVLSHRGTCGWQRSKLGGWGMWARVVVRPLQRDLPQGIHRYGTAMCAHM